MKNNLAIVIPAYKINFFKDVMDSLCNQTCKDFNVYIGIDACDSDFESVICQYHSSLNIIYKRFDTNFGRKDLVAQWDRCIKLTHDEEWVMLFSDDDILDIRCVESFYKELAANKKKYDLYHFNVDVIDENNNIKREPQPYPAVYDSTNFLKHKCSARIESFVVEYIFRRTTFDAVGGFERFDMAWGTDIATWAKIGREQGIKTISGSKVMWRESSVNITPDVTKARIVRKLQADACFLEWCRSHFNGITLSDTYYYMFRLLFHYSPYMKKNDLPLEVKSFYKVSFAGGIICHCIMALYPVLRIISNSRHHSS